jgi:Cu/Ag efflux protein CusF
MRGILTALVIVFLAVLGVGLYLDWFRFSVRRNPENDKVNGVSFNVNRERVAQDAARAGEGIRNFGKKVQQTAHKAAAEEARQTHEVRGRLTSVDEGNHRLTLKTAENDSLTLQTGPATKVRRNEVEVNLNGLMEGDRLQVVYKDEDGKHVAQSITVVPGT